MPESKLEKLLFVLIAIFLTNIFSALFQINLTLTIIFNLICVSIFLILYFLGYILRNKILITIKNPIKRIINDLEEYEKNREDIELERKIINRLYKNFKLCLVLGGEFIINSGGNNEKTFFNFKKAAGSMIFQGYFWKLSNNKPYQFQMNNKRDNAMYSSKKMSPPDQKPEVRREKLQKCLNILREFLELI